MPLPELAPESEVRLWDPRARQPPHQVRLDLPRSVRGALGRSSNELLCKRASIPRDFVHVRARLGTHLVRPYGRPPSKDRPWAQYRQVGASEGSALLARTWQSAWTWQSEQQVIRWLLARKMPLSHARERVAPALHALGVPERQWIATLNEMGTDGICELQAQSIREQQQEAKEEPAAVEAEDVHMELQIEMPTDPVEVETLQMQLRTDLAAALGVDVSQIGEVELSTPH